MLEVRDLRLVYPNGYEALKSVSLTVNRGEIVGVIGRSGAGKSTLLRCINGLEPATSGSVVLDGEDVTSSSGEQAARAAEPHRLHLAGVQPRRAALGAEQRALRPAGATTAVLRSLLRLLRPRRRARSPCAASSASTCCTAPRSAPTSCPAAKSSASPSPAPSPSSRRSSWPTSRSPASTWSCRGRCMADLARVARDEGVPTLINIHAIELARAFCDRIVGIAQGVVVFDGDIGGLDEATIDRIYRFDRPPCLPCPGSGHRSASWWERRPDGGLRAPLRTRRRDSGRLPRAPAAPAAAAHGQSDAADPARPSPPTTGASRARRLRPAELVDGLPNICALHRAPVPAEFDTTTPDAADAGDHRSSA